MNTASDFQERWWRKCETLSEGEWGRRVRLFYHIFYGEGLVVHPGKKYHKEADSRPFAGGWLRVCTHSTGHNISIALVDHYTAMP